MAAHPLLHGISVRIEGSARSTDLEARDIEETILDFEFLHIPPSDHDTDDDTDRAVRSPDPDPLALTTYTRHEQGIQVLADAVRENTRIFYEHVAQWQREDEEHEERRRRLDAAAEADVSVDDSDEGENADVPGTDGN